MTHADQLAAEHFRHAITAIRAAKCSLSKGRGYLPASPRDSKALKLAAALLKVERELEALSVPEPMQTEMRGVA